ncbi:hypothetical protein GCM10027347_49250 [Larkinella harenae]
MKFYRLIFLWINLLLMGWVLGLWAGSSVRSDQALVLKVATIDTPSAYDNTEHLSDDLTDSFVNEAIVAPTVSHQIPLYFFAIIPTVWVLMKRAKLLQPYRIPFYFFSYFRRIFGHHIAINAP